MANPPWRHHAKLPSGRFPSRVQESGLKQWAMVLFESVGMMSVILVLALVLVAVGIFVQMIWPLTDWDLLTVMLEQYQCVPHYGLRDWLFCRILVCQRAAWNRMKRPRPIFAQKLVARSRR